MLDCHWLIDRNLCVYAGFYVAYKINPSPWNGTQTAIAYVCVYTRRDLRRSITPLRAYLRRFVCAVRSAYYGLRSINPTLLRYTATYVIFFPFLPAVGLFFPLYVLLCLSYVFLRTIFPSQLLYSSFFATTTFFWSQIFSTIFRLSFWSCVQPISSGY